VLTRLASSSYTAPDNTGIAAIESALSTNLDVAVSTRLASSSYTAPDNADIAAIKAKTDNLPASPAATGDAMALSGDFTATMKTSLDASTPASVQNIVAQTADIGARIPANLVMSAGKIWALDGNGNPIAPESETAAIKSKTDNLPTSPAATGDIPTTAEIADKVLGRNLAGGADGGRVVRDALRFGRNKVVIAAGVVTVYAEDDTTVAWTGTVTTDSEALPITGVDPA
jgi:hypothetical protein